SFFQGGKEAGGVIPAAFIESDKWHTRLDETPRQESTLPERATTIDVARPIRFAIDVKGRLRFSGGHQLAALPVVFIQSGDRVGGNPVVDAQHVIDLPAEFLARSEAIGA